MEPAKKFTTTCQICDKEYDNYMRTFYVQEKGIKIRVCPECRRAFCRDKYVFTNHIPAFYEGGDLISHCFYTEEELLDYITSNTKDNYTCCMDQTGTIIDVCTAKKFWWVRGYSNLTYGQLPNWKELV